MNDEAAQKSLGEYLKMLEIKIDESQLKLFNEFYETLVCFNQKFNITNITGARDFTVKHVADSLSGAKYIDCGAKVCDIGPGGGFPSVPLKIMRKDISLTLFEASRKKTDYLNTLALRLGLESFNCFHLRAEEAARREFRESFDTVVARAVAPLNVLLEYALPLAKKGGKFIAYKAAADEEIKASANAARLLGAEKIAEERFSLPIDGYGRTLVVFKKVSPTPAVYPRGGGLARSRPL